MCHLSLKIEQKPSAHGYETFDTQWKATFEAPSSYEMKAAVRTYESNERAARVAVRSSAQSDAASAHVGGDDDDAPAGISSPAREPHHNGVYDGQCDSRSADDSQSANVPRHNEAAAALDSDADEATYIAVNAFTAGLRMNKHGTVDSLALHMAVSDAFHTFPITDADAIAAALPDSTALSDSFDIGNNADISRIFDQLQTTSSCASSSDDRASSSAFVSTTSDTRSFHDTSEILCFNTTSIGDDAVSSFTPKNNREAKSCAGKHHWRFAKINEHESLVKAGTWTLVGADEARNVATGKWVFKIKLHADGSFDRYKARWVVRGFSQRHGVDYDETFAPTARCSSIRTLAAISNQHQLHMFGEDVSNAFARADMVGHEVYVEQPHDFVQLDEHGKPLVCKLEKGLYGTKQGARLWNRKIRSLLIRYGWAQFETDPCIYSRRGRFGLEFIGVYVDDIIHSCDSVAAHDDFHEWCNSHFPTTNQGEITSLLGIRFRRDFAKRILTLDQTAMVHRILAENNVPFDANAQKRAASTPMEAKWEYDESSPLLSDDDMSHYRHNVCSILHVANCTRPDLSLALGILCRYLHKPTEHCSIALRRLLRYLSGTSSLGLVYRGTTGVFRLEGYSDSTWGGSYVDRLRSTSGYVCKLGGGAVSWSSHIQPITAQSSAEAELIALDSCAHDVVHLRSLLQEFYQRQAEPTLLWEDNTACIGMSKNPINFKRNKHIGLRYFYVRDLIEDHRIRVEYIPTARQTADLLTKPLDRGRFASLRSEFVECVSAALPHI